MYDLDGNENFQTQDQTNDYQEEINNNKQNIQKYINDNETYKENDEIKSSDEDSNNSRKVFIYDKQKSNKEIKQELPKRGIHIDTKEINEGFHTNRFNKKFANQKNHKQKKRKALNQCRMPINQYNMNFINQGHCNILPFQMNQMNNQGQSYNPNNYFNNNNIQNMQYMNNNSQMRDNNYGMYNNMNMNNFNQNMPPRQNMAAMQQMLLYMKNMNLNGNYNNMNMNNQNRYPMNMMNNMYNTNNMQNQNQNFGNNNGINFPFTNIFGNYDPNNKEEMFVRIIKENTGNGQKVTKIKFKRNYIKNDKNTKYKKK